MQRQAQRTRELREIRERQEREKQRIADRLSADLGKTRGEERETEDERGKSLSDRALETKDRMRGDPPGTARAERDRGWDYDR